MCINRRSLQSLHRLISSNPGILSIQLHPEKTSFRTNANPEKFHVINTVLALLIHFYYVNHTSIVFLLVCCSVVADPLQPRGLLLGRLLCPWGFSRQEYWSGLVYPLPGDLPNPGIKPRSPSLQADSLPS